MFLRTCRSPVPAVGQFLSLTNVSCRDAWYIQSRRCRAVNQLAVHAATSDIEDVGVDHRRSHIRVSQEFLHGTNVVAGLQEVRSKRVPQRVRRSGLGYAGRGDGLLERALKGVSRLGL